MKNDDSSIKYLIKFVSKRDYGESLLDGKLFMHTAHYYHELEKKYGPGQGDLREGNVIPGIAIYQVLSRLLIEEENEQKSATANRQVPAI